MLARTRNTLLATAALLVLAALALHGCSSGGGGGPPVGGSPSLQWDGGNWDQDLWG